MRRGFIFLLLFSCYMFVLQACTTAIVSGRATADGRPLLYKHRDSGTLSNSLRAFNDGRFQYIGIVNSSDSIGAEVWGGYNSTGFAIMNSASYNLNSPAKGEEEEREGVVMKLALQQCATLADFERLLDSLPRPMMLSANFGVIDAHGGAAYYETGHNGFVKFDANDIEVAPEGYLLRTNSSVSGDASRDMGLSRYLAEEALFRDALLTNSISPRFLMQDVSRCLKHGLTHVDLNLIMPTDDSQSVFVAFRDFIPRYSTASAITVQGVKAGEAPLLTTMWTMMGTPLATICVPVWLNNKGIYPRLLMGDQEGKSQLCEWGLIFKKQLFPIEVSEGKDYLNLAVLLNNNGNGILQKVQDFEKTVWQQSEDLQHQFRKEGLKINELSRFCRKMDTELTDFYLNTLPLLSY